MTVSNLTLGIVLEKSVRVLDYLACSQSQLGLWDMNVAKSVEIFPRSPQYLGYPRKGCGSTGHVCLHPLLFLGHMSEETWKAIGELCKCNNDCFILISTMSP